MLHIDHREIGPGVAVIHLAGKLMIGTEHERVEGLVKDLLRIGYRVVIFDLDGLTHLDSTGIGRFIASMGHAMSAEAQIVMAAAAPQIRESFRVTRLDTVFRFFDSVPAAHSALV